MVKVVVQGCYSTWCSAWELLRQYWQWYSCVTIRKWTILPLSVIFIPKCVQQSNWVSFMTPGKTIAANMFESFTMSRPKGAAFVPNLPITQNLHPGILQDVCRHHLPHSNVVLRSVSKGASRAPLGVLSSHLRVFSMDQRLSRSSRRPFLKSLTWQPVWILVTWLVVFSHMTLSPRLILLTKQHDRANWLHCRTMVAFLLPHCMCACYRSQCCSFLIFFYPWAFLTTQQKRHAPSTPCHAQKTNTPVLRFNWEARGKNALQLTWEIFQSCTVDLNRKEFHL